MKFFRFTKVAAFAVAICMHGVATAKAKENFSRPTYAGAYEPQGTDERGIWMETDEAERVFRDAPFIERDAGLNAFVKSVLCRTVGFDRCTAVRVYIVKNSAFNASMYPNGMMLVHTGLLTRLHSEAEIAAVLGHEFAHFELRHSLKEFRKRRNADDLMNWISLLGVVTNTNVSATQNSIVTSFYSFSRSQETEADLLSAAFVRASPFKLRASQVWQRLFDEGNALRTARGMRKLKRYYPGPTETHPTDLQRIAYFTKLEVEALAAGDFGEDGMDEYRTVTSPMLPQLFDSLVSGNEFAAADYVIRARGDTLGWNGLMLSVRGELYRLRANPRDIVTAREFFAKATTFPDAPAEAWRGFGLTSLRLGEVPDGQAAISEYLKRQPSAKDAAAMKLLLGN